MYMHTYIQYITLHYITLHYTTLHTYIHAYKNTLRTYTYSPHTYIPYIHTYIHKCITYIQAHIHTLHTLHTHNIHTYMHAYIHTYITLHKYLQTYIHYMHTCMHTYIHALLGHVRQSCNNSVYIIGVRIGQVPACYSVTLFRGANRNLGVTLAEGQRRPMAPPRVFPWYSHGILMVYLWNSAGWYSATIGWATQGIPRLPPAVEIG